MRYIKLMLLILGFHCYAQVDTTNMISAFNFVDYSPLRASVNKLGANDSTTNSFNGLYGRVFNGDSVLTSAAATSNAAFDISTTNGVIQYKALTAAEITDLKDGDFTIVMWTKLATLPGSLQAYWQLDAATDGLAYAYKGNSVKNWFVGADVSGSNVNYDLGILADTDWHHLTWVYDNTNSLIKFYLDSVETQQAWTGPLNPAASLDELHIASFDYNMSTDFDGFVKSCFLYGDAKTATWVQAEYAKLNTTTGRLNKITVSAVTYTSALGNFFYDGSVLTMASDTLSVSVP